MIRAIISDLDGTILPRGGHVSQETAAVLRRIGSTGTTRIIATGRSLFAARKILTDDFPIDYLVFSSGAGIMRWAGKQIIQASHLNLAETREIAGYLWNYNINFTIQKEIPDNHHFYYTDIYPVHADYRQRIETYLPFGTPISCCSDILTPSTQLIVILDALQLKLVTSIREGLSAYSIVRSTSPIDNQAIWLEVFPQGINKGTTCGELLRRLGIPCAACAGLGNDYNDVDFLDICGVSFLVGNAPNGLKPYYKSVAPDRDNGFSEFIKKVLF